MATVRNHALKLLENQHRNIERLFSRLQEPRSDRAGLFARLCDELTVHLSLEERLLYPSLLRVHSAKELAERIDEHVTLKRLLADLRDVSLEGESFKAGVLVLAELWNEHVDAEEQGLLREVRSLLSETELRTLGGEMQASKRPARL